MKKIIIASFLMLAFGINATAQNKKKSNISEKKVAVSLSPEQAAKNDGQAISEFLGLDNTKTVDFINLFVLKHQNMLEQSSTVESRREMSRIIGLKIEASLDSKQLEKLMSNATLYNQLLSTDAIETK